MKKSLKLNATHFAIILFLVGLLILPAITPLFKKDFFKMHDFTHVARLVELDLALKDGHFPARWSRNLGWGFGMPLFQFYAPLPYYISELFHLLGFSFLNSIKICFGLTFFISFLGMFLLAKKFWGKWGAFLAALVFVYSPYRAVDFYVRGALGELFAISLIPWVLWLITEVIDRRTKKWIGLCSLFFALFLLSHTVLNLICFPLFLLFGGFYLFLGCHSGEKRSGAIESPPWSEGDSISLRQLADPSRMTKSTCIKACMRLFVSFSLGIGLASFFLIPAFFEKKFSQVEKLIDGYSHYSHHFLYFRQFIWGNWGYGGSVDGIEDGLSLHLGKVHLALAAITIAFSLINTVSIGKIKTKLAQLGLGFKGNSIAPQNAGLQNDNMKPVEKRNLIIVFFISLSLILSFLSTYHAKPIWDALPIMAFIQFPWRFNSFIIVAVAFLAGGGVFYFAKISRKLGFVFMFAAILLLLKTNLKYFRPAGYITPSDYYYTDQQLIKKNMSGIIPDYIPIWAEEHPQEIAEKEYQVISGDAKLEITKSKTHQLFLKSISGEKSKIRLNRFYFPGWKLFIDDRETAFDYKNNNGIITVSLSPGEHTLKLIFTRTPIRIFSEIVSAISILAIVYMFL